MAKGSILLLVSYTNFEGGASLIGFAGLGFEGLGFRICRISINI
jgi:hypothetical protein